MDTAKHAVRLWLELNNSWGSGAQLQVKRWSVAHTSHSFFSEPFLQGSLTWCYCDLTIQSLFVVYIVNDLTFWITTEIWNIRVVLQRVHDSPTVVITHKLTSWNPALPLNSPAHWFATWTQWPNAAYGAVDAVDTHEPKTNGTESSWWSSINLLLPRFSQLTPTYADLKFMKGVIGCANVCLWSVRTLVLLLFIYSPHLCACVSAFPHTHT